MSQTLYQLLNLPKTASRDEIERACWQLWEGYRSKSNSPLLRDILKQIEQAHSILLDPLKRASYDAQLALDAQVVLKPRSRTRRLLRSLANRISERP